MSGVGQVVTVVVTVEIAVLVNDIVVLAAAYEKSLLVESHWKNPSRHTLVPSRFPMSLLLTTLAGRHVVTVTVLLSASVIVELVLEMNLRDAGGSNAICSSRGARGPTVDQ